MIAPAKTESFGHSCHLKLEFVTLVPAVTAWDATTTSTILEFFLPKLACTIKATTIATKNPPPNTIKIFLLGGGFLVAIVVAKNPPPNTIKIFLFILGGGF